MASTLNPWRADAPFNALPLLPPAGDVESRVILKQCIVARAALAELKQAAELIPNQGILINTLPLLEAKSSSEIENIVTTTDRLFQFRELDEKADPDTKEAIRYSRALLEGFRELRERRLSTGTAEKICTRIRDVNTKVRKIPGTALTNSATGEIIYTPPAGEQHLRGLLRNWEIFLHETPDLDPLVRMAAAHYQFEAIHPFVDGNGRTGRILNSLYLVQENLLTLPILYLSRYIIKNKSEYYQRLLDITRRQAWEGWILYLLRGVEETAIWTTNKIAAVRQLFRATSRYVKSAAPKIYSHELINLIFERPYCRISDLDAAGIAKRQTGSRYLLKLVDLGILQEQIAGRDKLFLHPEFLQLLTRDSNRIRAYS